MCRVYFTLLLGITILGLGCGRTKTYTGPDGEKATVTEKGDNFNMTVTGNNGEKIQFSTNKNGVSLPDNFPKDAPIYSGATVTTNANTPAGMMVMLITGDSLNQVKEYYEKELKEQGWENEGKVDIGQSSTMTYKKADRTLTLQISTGEQTMIHLVVTPEKAR